MKTHFLRETSVRLILCLLLLPTISAAGAESGLSSAKEIIMKSIQAHGGAGALQQWNDLYAEGRTISYYGTTEMRGTSSITIHDGRMMRRDGKVSFRGSTFTFSEASTGKTAWQSRRGRVYDFPPDNSNHFLSHLPTILLRAASADPSALTLVGDAERDGVDVQLIDFEEGTSSTRLALSAANHLLHSLEFKAKENSGMGTLEEKLNDLRFEEYGTVSDLAFPHKWTALKDGVKRSVFTVEAVRFEEVADLEIFAKPEADLESMDWRDQLAR